MNTVTEQASETTELDKIKAQAAALAEIVKAQRKLIEAMRRDLMSAANELDKLYAVEWAMKNPTVAGAADVLAAWREVAK